MIRQIQSMLQNKQCSCEELVKSYLAAIARENDRLMAYVRVTQEQALEAARAADAKLAAGQTLAPLEGIPMSLKDNISTKQVETTCCSNILKGYVPIYNATVWERLSDAGAVLLGKTNMDEFAMGSSGETSCYGGAKNPYNDQRVPGGSSSGSACAVGADLAVYSLGSDTGGSIRQPASFCGAVGLKPTYGAVSRYGLIAFASSLDQIGPLTHSAEDAAIVFDAISAQDPMDSTSRGAKERTTLSLNNEIKGLRIGVAPEYFQGAQPDVEQAVMNAAETFQKMGASVSEVSLPKIAYGLPVYYILACAEASSNLGRYDGIRYGYRASGYASTHEMICKTRSQGFGKEVQRRILLGTYVLSSGYYDAYYKKAQSLRGSIIAEFERAFGECDLLLAPTSPTTALERGFSHRDPVETYQTDICTATVNIAGLPAVSVPCGFDGGGLPIGMQLIGPKFSEAKLLNAAHCFEKQTDGEFLSKIKGGMPL